MDENEVSSFSSIEDLEKAANSTGSENVEQVEQTNEEIGVAVEVPAFTPNLKFKVHDKEMEFDPLFHGIIKDADTEKKIREFHEKAHGLDVIKPKYQTLKDEHKRVSEVNTRLIDAVKELDSVSKNKDFRKIAEILGLDKKDIIKYAYEEATYDELSPEQRAAYDAQINGRRESSELRKRNEQLEAYQQQVFHQQMQYEHMTKLSQATSRQEVAPVVQAYNSQNGDGAFERKVRERGFYIYNETGRDPEEADVVNMLVKELSGFVRPQAQQAQQVQQAQVNAVSKDGKPMVAQQRKQTLPNVKGSGQSIVDKPITSIEDIERIRNSKF